MSLDEMNEIPVTEGNAFTLLDTIIRISEKAIKLQKQWLFFNVVL
jgi:hypothetical protein